jgi:hypothetical protein
VASRNGGRPYALVYLEPAKDVARRCLALALKRRVARALSSDIQLIEAQLSARPIRWGDPLNHLRAMELVRCRGHSTFFYVYYGVHRKSRTVYIRDLQIDPYGPLA